MNEPHSNRLTDSYRLDNQSHVEIFDSGRSFAIWLTVGGLGFFLLFMALSAVHIFSPGLKPQDIADHDLTAPDNAQVIDHPETARAIERARQSIIPVFQVDRSRNVQSLTAVEASLSRIAKLQQAGIEPLASSAPPAITAGPATKKNKGRLRPGRGSRVPGGENSHDQSGRILLR